ncbi:alpha/beta hydrolase [Occultella kanbiaonis]|uniref:alpha/beta hydrolase n=1 Tax=Occultella kanbiaonis TaxID=2675754 RepID=UPI0013D01C9A|nr:hypothetical protein [Occultella kanbiaonis]
MNNDPSGRDRWCEWLGAEPDPAGTWDLGPAIADDALGGTTRDLTLHTFGADLPAVYHQPALEAVAGAVVVVPFYDTPPLFGRASARTERIGRRPASAAFAVELARAGLAVLAVPWWFEQVAASDPRTAAALGLDERYGPAAEQHLRSLPMTALGRSVGDLMLAVTALRGELGRSRIAVFGHSLGGKLALHLTALDDRVVAGVAHEPGLGLAHSNWDAPWYLGDRRPVDRDQDDLLAQVAPRPFLLAGGGASDGAHNQALVERARTSWPGGQGLDTLMHNGGHPVPHHVLIACTTWLADRLSEEPGT